jgi:hypothetical protein
VSPDALKPVDRTEGRARIVAELMMQGMLDLTIREAVVVMVRILAGTLKGNDMDLEPVVALLRDAYEVDRKDLKMAGQVGLTPS